MIESCCRSGGLVLWLLMRPPPEAPWPPDVAWTVGFDGARKISAAPPVISRTRLPPPVMSWAITLATVRPIIKEIRGKRRFVMLGFVMLGVHLLTGRLHPITPTEHKLKRRLIEIVELEADGLRASAFQTIHHLHHFTIANAARRFDENCLLDAQRFRHVKAIEHLGSIDFVAGALFKQRDQLLIEFRDIIDRAHVGEGVEAQRTVG